MFAVRFVALTALAVWLGGMVAAMWLTDSPSGSLDGQARVLGYVSGGVVLVSLFVIKFVGPPPPQFPLRAGIVAAMIVLLLSTQAMHVVSVAPTAINVLLALALLSWYARE